MADCKAYKVYFYHGDAKKQAVKLPKKWVAEKKVEAAIQLWTDGYNAKHPDATVDVSRVRFTEKNGTEIPRHKDIKTGCQDYQDILVVIDEEVVEEEVDPTLLKCFRYGCVHQTFREEDNTDTSCNFHEGHPVFHDCSKWWSCCPQRKHAEWEDFMKEPPCCTGRHSNVKPKIIEAPQEDIPEPMFTGAKPEDFESEQEIELREEAAAKEAEAALWDWEPDIAEDGSATCANLACQQKFNVVDNHDCACQHHPGPLIFHDCKKGYACCKRTTYDFDDFLKLPTCATGPHVPKQRKVKKKA